MTDLERKETQAIDFIRSASKHREYVVSYSGGKDSEVVLHLFKKAKVPFSVVYRNTTIDPPYTLQHVLSRGATILQPRYRFFELIRKKGLPSFTRRFCCEYLKEPYIAPYIALGIRREESQKRQDLYIEPASCRIYTKKRYTEQLLPILYWSSEDIASYIEQDNIQCHPLYYDEKGRFCPSRRLGCLGCPLPWDRSIDDFKKYPKLVRIWCRNLREFRVNHPDSSANILFRNEYDQFANNLFYHELEKFHASTYGLFPIDWHERLQEIFHVDL